MERIIYTGIDIGSKNLKIMSIEFIPESNKTKILYKENYPSNGITDGYISNPDLFNQAFSEALKKYKRTTKIEIDEAIISIDSIDLKSKILKITHDIANESNITDLDTSEIEKKILSQAKRHIQGEILNNYLIKYRINDYDYYSDIEGLSAKKIIAEYLFIYLPANHLTTLEKILTKNDVSIINLFSGNSISSEINLDKDDKNLGIININIGADITSLSIWENNTIVFLTSINYGSDDITKKISLQNKISFSEAELLKKNPEDAKTKKIIKESFKELSKKIKNILIDLEKDELLPAGAVLYGGGSKSEFAQEILKENLSIPIKKYPKNISDSATDYHNIYGGIIHTILHSENAKIFNFSGIKNNFKKLFSKFKK